MGYPDSILGKVTHPARYTGGEWNGVRKDWDEAEVRIALIYPDLYEIGMSNLALPILYDLLNKRPQVLCERSFAPWLDMEAAMREGGMPLLSLESQHPLGEFDIIGFSLGYELTYTNVLNMLDLAQIPVLASERGNSHPLIIAGGSCALNPEPMSDFIDLFVIGEGEEVVLELVDAFQNWRRWGGSKAELMRQSAKISGVYVPSLYEVSYHPDDTTAKFTPIASEASPTIQRRVITELPPPPTKPVVPYVEVIHDRAAVEIQRGCSRGCRFCQAGMIYRPTRRRSQEQIAGAVGEIIENCGYSEVSLLSLSTGDYPEIEKLVSALHEHHGENNLTLSLPSLRVDNFSTELMESLGSQKKRGLTFAPEAGSERLRRVINKSISHDQFLETVAAVFARGWMSLKLYFMVGLPTENLDDISGIVELVGEVYRLVRRVKGRQPRIGINFSTFVPKSHTPFQWVAQETEDRLKSKYEVLRSGLGRWRVRFSWQDPKVSLLEAVLARGDRRLGKVIYHAWQRGCTFDAWSERFNWNKWLLSFEECGISPDFYAHRERPLDELLPWAHIDIGVSTGYLKREYLRALSEEATGDCQYGKCNACGLQLVHPDCRRKFGELLA